MIELTTDKLIEYAQKRTTFMKLCRDWKVNASDIYKLNKGLFKYIAFLKSFKRLDEDTRKLLRYILLDTVTVAKRAEGFGTKPKRLITIAQALDNVKLTEKDYRKLIQEWYVYYMQEVVLSIENTYTQKLKHYNVQLFIDEKGERLTVYDERNGKLILDYEPNKSD